jgi:hypothetical protein
VKFSTLARPFDGAGDFVGVAEIALQSKRPKPASLAKSSAIRSWLRHVVDGYIPFAEARRRHFLQQPAIAAHAEMYYSIDDSAK